MCVKREGEDYLMFISTRKKVIKELVAVAFFLLACLCVNTIKVQAATKAKVVLEFTDGTKESWETGDEKIELGERELAYVYFGNYPQKEVTGKKLTKAITSAEYNKNGVATVKGVKYRKLAKKKATYAFSGTKEDCPNWTYYDWAGRKYAYFKFEPIKWRVLYSDSDTAFLLSEYGLDGQKYNKDEVDIAWADCTLRKWINSKFFNMAFNTKERKLILDTELENEPNPYYGTEGGDVTTDKVFLLSYRDALRTSYGFANSTSVEDIVKRCTSTEFAKAMGVLTYTYDYPKYFTEDGQRSSGWWLRSPGSTSFFSTTRNSGVGTNSNSAIFVRSDGSVALSGLSVTDTDFAVRPALYLDLSKIIK